jgi:hypothetical protein
METPARASRRSTNADRGEPATARRRSPRSARDGPGSELTGAVEGPVTASAQHPDRRRGDRARHLERRAAHVGRRLGLGEREHVDALDELPLRLLPQRAGLLGGRCRERLLGERLVLRVLDGHEVVAAVLRGLAEEEQAQHDGTAGGELDESGVPVVALVEVGRPARRVLGDQLGGDAERVPLLLHLLGRRPVRRRTAVVEEADGQRFTVPRPQAVGAEHPAGLVEQRACGLHVGGRQFPERATRDAGQRRLVDQRDRLEVLAVGHQLAHRGAVEGEREGAAHALVGGRPIGAFVEQHLADRVEHADGLLAGLVMVKRGAVGRRGHALGDVRAVPERAIRRVGLVGDVRRGGLRGERGAVGAGDAVLEPVRDRDRRLLPALGEPRDELTVRGEVGERLVSVRHQPALHEGDAGERRETARVVVQRDGERATGDHLAGAAAGGVGEHRAARGERAGVSSTSTTSTARGSAPAWMARSTAWRLAASIASARSATSHIWSARPPASAIAAPTAWRRRRAPGAPPRSRPARSPAPGSRRPRRPRATARRGRATSAHGGLDAVVRDRQRALECGAGGAVERRQVATGDGGGRAECGRIRQRGGRATEQQRLLDDAMADRVRQWHAAPDVDERAAAHAQAQDVGHAEVGAHPADLARQRRLAGEPAGQNTEVAGGAADVHDDRGVGAGEPGGAADRVRGPGADGEHGWRAA